MIRIPSKTFLLGEYAILKGAPALLLGHGPWFEVSYSSGTGHPFHPESPAGQWLLRHPFSGRISFHDPHQGAGGFGGSGAEFVAAFGAGKQEKDQSQFAWDAWRASRTFPGSGADILTQAWGMGREKEFFLGIHLQEQKLHPLEPSLGLTLALFHTGKKLPTHLHLECPALPLEEMQHLVEEGISALVAGSGLRFAGALNTYASLLAGLGLQAPHTASALAKLPQGILAAKGCGAMGADVIALLYENAQTGPWAQANSLAEVARLSV